jgi:hypothetical protein
MAEKGHYGGRPGKTLQGIYVCTPSGAFLASINSTRADRVAEMLRRALKAWAALPAEKRPTGAGEKVEPSHRWEDSFPKDGLVLSMIARDLPTACDPRQPAEVKWNQDRIWFSRDEARQWIPKNPIKGAKHAVPASLVSRLARFHLVDTVRGQTSGFRPSDVRQSKILATVVDRTGTRVKIEISGQTRSDSKRRSRSDDPHGISTRILGRATYDLDRGAFVEFEVVALGRRWGRTRFNDRRRGPPSSPVGFVLRLAASDAPRVAPAYIFSYDADWVKRPPRRRSSRKITGKKQDEQPGLTGTWKITQQSSRGATSMTLVFKDDNTGTLTTGNRTLKLKAVRRDGNQLSFKVTLKFGERDVPMVFHGTVSGTRLEGKLTAP